MPIINSIKTYAIQIGQSTTDTQNFQLSANNDGTGKLARKSDGTGGDILSWDANGIVTQTKQMTLGTAQATTGGTSIDFTGIPSWVKRITVLLNGISTNGISFQQIQIGAGSMDVTGYNSNSFSDTATANSTTGFLAQTNIANAGYSISGRIELSLFSSSTNTWLMSGVVSYTGTGAAAATSGNKTLSGTLDRLRLTTVNGTDTFDAGSVNILYEG
jgi:hypothetical protein